MLHHALDRLSDPLLLGALLGLPATLLIAAVGAVGAHRRRELEREIEALRAQTSALGAAAERARSLLEAQGDLIVRRDADACITARSSAAPARS